MKNLVLLGLMLTMTLIKVYGQKSPFTITSPLFEVRAEEKAFFTDSNGISVKETDSNSLDLVYINPTWIDSIGIIKGKEAVEKYGPRGQNGVVVMILNKDGFNQMREIDREKFQR